VVRADDVHWADPGVDELLGALLHRPPAAPVLVALAARPRQMGERLGAAIERAHRAGTIARIELEALSAEEARELIGDGADATGLYEDSGGNPFYLEQLARSADRPDRPTPAEEPSLAGVDVPAAVAAALAEELALLSEQARLILEGAAVAGEPFDPELAAAAAGAAEAVAMCADELRLINPETDVRGASGSGICSFAARYGDARRLAAGRTSAAPRPLPFAVH
jgi:predicted ATPase